MAKVNWNWGFESHPADGLPQAVDFAVKKADIGSLVEHLLNHPERIPVDLLEKNSPFKSPRVLGSLLQVLLTNYSPAPGTPVPADLSAAGQAAILGRTEEAFAFLIRNPYQTESFCALLLGRGFGLGAFRFRLGVALDSARRDSKETGPTILIQIIRQLLGKNHANMTAVRGRIATLFDATTRVEQQERQAEQSKAEIERRIKELEDTSPTLFGGHVIATKLKFIHEAGRFRPVGLKNNLLMTFRGDDYEITLEELKPIGEPLEKIGLTVRYQKESKAGKTPGLITVPAGEINAAIEEGRLKIVQGREGGYYLETLPVMPSGRA